MRLLPSDGPGGHDNPDALLDAARAWLAARRVVSLREKDAERVGAGNSHSGTGAHESLVEETVEVGNEEEATFSTRARDIAILAMGGAAVVVGAVVGIATGNPTMGTVFGGFTAAFEAATAALVVTAPEREADRLVNQDRQPSRDQPTRELDSPGASLDYAKVVAAERQAYFKELLAARHAEGMSEELAVFVDELGEAEPLVIAKALKQASESGVFAAAPTVSLDTGLGNR